MYYSSGYDAPAIIKSQVSARQVAELFGIKTDQHGFCCCPFHREDTASCKMYDGDKGFYCFGCHAHGDVIKLAMDLGGLTFKGALQYLNESFGCGVTFGKPLTLAQRRQMAQAELERKRKAHEQWLDQFGLEFRWAYLFDWWIDLTRCIDVYKRCGLGGTSECWKLIQELDFVTDRLEKVEDERVRQNGSS